MAGKQNTAKWDTTMENIVRSAIDALKQDDTFSGNITGQSVYNYLKDQNCTSKYMTVLEKDSLKINRKVRKILKSDQENEDLASQVGRKQYK
ncbi:hypothetical protein P8452_25387 [Trifolium repens]|nr:hypothetical protein P8452_25387 [Trifolium repens]